MSVLLSVLLLTGACAFLPGAVSAEILTVRQDGSAPFTTLAAAMVIAQDGDVIRVGPGEYVESIRLDLSLSFESIDGPGYTTLKGTGNDRIVSLDGYFGDIRCSFTGFTFTGGREYYGGAIFAENESWLSIDDCVFEDNEALRCGGAIFADGPLAVIDIRNSEFVDNRAGLGGGALFIDGYIWCEVTNCTFESNSSSSGGGAIDSGYYGNLAMSHSMLTDNVGGNASALRTDGAWFVVEFCTFHDNDAAAGATVYLQRGYCTFTGNVVTSERGGYGLWLGEGDITHGCNIYYDNEAGAVTGGVADVTEKITDPLYCDFSSGDLAPCPSSPCLDEHDGCGQVGAFLVGCDECFGPVGVEPTTWGSLRSLYR